MDYEKIKKISIENFRNLEKAEIDFTESPIVSLVGENESGKTSAIKAFEVCATNDGSKNQKKYIRNGTDEFRVCIELMDGTKITRIKHSEGLNRYEIERPMQDKEIIDKVADGVPKEVQDLMGIVREPDTGEYLQVRTYEDLLLFAVTPASTNYKVMYNALKVEKLTGAIKAGSDEANQLRKDLDAGEKGEAALKEAQANIRVIDTKMLEGVEERLLELRKQTELAELARQNIKVLSKEASSDKEQIAKLEQVDEAVVKALRSVRTLTNKLSDKASERAVQIFEAKEADEKTLEIASKALKHKQKASELQAETPEYPVVTPEQLSAVTKMRKSISKLNDIRQTGDIKVPDEVSLDVMKKLEKIYSIGQQMGKLYQQEVAISNEMYNVAIPECVNSGRIRVVRCNNCNELVVTQ